MSQGDLVSGQNGQYHLIRKCNRLAWANGYLQKTKWQEAGQRKRQQAEWIQVCKKVHRYLAFRIPSTESGQVCFGHS